MPWVCTLRSLLLKRNRTFPSTVFSTYTMEEIWHQAHCAQQCCCPSYKWQRNTAKSRMDFTSHFQISRKYWCAHWQEHPSFYALTTLFPSISQSKQNHTRADKQDCDSNDDPIFSPTHFHSIKWPIPLVLSALTMMTLTRISAPSLLLCLFILAHCLNFRHGDNMTDIDQSV